MNARSNTDSILYTPSNPNIFNRKLNPQVEVIRGFHKGLEVEVNDKWFLSINDEGRLKLETLPPNIWIANIKSNYSLFDKQDMHPVGTGEEETLEIYRSLINTYNPLYHSISASIIETRQKRIQSSDVKKFRAYIEYPRKATPIIFLHYFAHFVPDEMQRLCASVNYDGYMNAPNGVRLFYKGIEFLAYNYTLNASQDDKYLVIEALDVISYLDFCTAARKISLVIGFFTATYVSGPLFIFDAEAEGDNPKFLAYNDCMCKSRDSIYPMLSLVPYTYYLDSDLKDEESIKKATNLESQLSPITRQQAEKLLELLDDEQFSMMFYTLHEASVSSLPLTSTTRLVLFAASIEMLAQWSRNKGNKSSPHSPMTEDNRQKILDQITNCVMDLTDDEKEKDIVIKRLRSCLFSPTNDEKLKQPFVYVGINLTEQEENLLNERNLILHGRNVIKVPFDPNKPDEYFNECENKCFAFYSLIWRVIMKAIGYNGIYKNVAELNAKLRTKESNDGNPLINHV